MIPDDVVSRAADAYRDNLEYDAFGDVGDDQRFDAMHAALVAARPYLMPGREEIAEALFNHANRNPLIRRYWSQAMKLDRADYLKRADAVLALLNGEIKKVAG